TVSNKLWRFDDVTSKIVLYRNMGFNESGEYKKTFIGSGVGTDSMQVLQGDEFEVEPHGNVDHVYREDSNEVAFAVLLKGHSILSLEGSLSVDCDMEKNGKWSCIYAVGSQEYQMVCTRLDIASADVGIDR
ncbi:hypothetical protein Tco_0288083, partial [Tanacetum coccineum]